VDCQRIVDDPDPRVASLRATYLNFSRAGQMTFPLSELQEFGEFVPELDARGRVEQALEEAHRIARDAHRALGAALNDYRCKRGAYAAAKCALEALA
jgi:hypothetical protein